MDRAVPQSPAAGLLNPNTADSGWSALLLAGGASRRMGRDKAMVQLDGEALWRRQWRTLQAAGAQEILAARGEQSGVEMEAAGLRLVRDVAGAQGPLAGLLAGLRTMRTQWLLALAVDLPLMPAGYLRRLLEEVAASGRGVVPQVAGRYEPLAAIYAQGCLPLAEESLREGAWSLQHLVKKLVAAGHLRTREVKAEEAVYFTNMNTPGDGAALGLK